MFCLDCIVDIMVLDKFCFEKGKSLVDFMVCVVDIYLLLDLV